ncbi:MAG: NAD(+)/NADH kinase [Metallosphaera sp.]|uniref:NAD(+) kinase n=3 Tax=Metallosphaera TaxID=41980 RepID=F4G2N9_METCR|nr:winged helix-turn-helix transcriptional regulator [Metallosphaera cuprina]AEB95087.1 NAD(+) kinase [Metallosphaera cuprina Ar-4]
MAEPRIESVSLRAEEVGEKVKDKAERVLSSYNVKVREEGYDAIMIIGTDSYLLHILQNMRTEAPIFHVSPPSYNTFYSSVDWEELDLGVRKISRGEYHVDHFTRLKVALDREIYSLNEVAIFPSRSATLMEYSLYVDDEMLWKDRADGVIVSTPAGSTAYAFSAGGPMVIRGAKVFIAVPVNSLNPMRRSLVISDDSKLVIEPSSVTSIEAVIDGISRIKVKNRILIEKGTPAPFIRLFKKLGENIERKAKLSIEQGIPPSAKFVLKMLQIYGEASIKELLERTGLPERTIRYALSVLVKEGIVKRVTNPRNLQQRIYKVAEKAK